MHARARAFACLALLVASSVVSAHREATIPDNPVNRFLDGQEAGGDESRGCRRTDAPQCYAHGGVSGNYVRSAGNAYFVTDASPAEILVSHLGVTVLPNSGLSAWPGACDLEVVDGTGQLDEESADGHHGTSGLSLANLPFDLLFGPGHTAVDDGTWDDGGLDGACHRVTYDEAAFNTPGCEGAAHAEDLHAGSDVWIAAQCDMVTVALSFEASGWCIWDATFEGLDHEDFRLCAHAADNPFVTCGPDGVPDAVQYGRGGGDLGQGVPYPYPLMLDCSFTDQAAGIHVLDHLAAQATSDSSAFVGLADPFADVEPGEPDPAVGVMPYSAGWIDWTPSNGPTWMRPPAITVTALQECSDGVDNDGDGQTDTVDTDCSDARDRSESLDMPACRDLADNDDDGVMDYPLDPGCSGFNDDLELDPCSPSKLEVVGTPSTHGATYDGSTKIRLTEGTNRKASNESVNATGGILADHDDGAGVHEWSVHALDAGKHSVWFNATVRCTTDGATEHLNVTYSQWSAGSKCRAARDMTAAPEFIVGFKELTLTPGNSYAGGTVQRTSAELRFAVVAVPVANLDSFLSQVTTDTNARYCEVNPKIILNSADTYWTQQYGPALVGAPGAWASTKGNTNRNICVVDSGLDATHADLSGPRVLAGQNMFNDTAFTADTFGHGTHVAGIAAATIDNNIGIAGIAQAGIIPVVVVRALPNGTLESTGDRLAEAILWCEDHDGHVINLSLSTEYSQGIAEAIDLVTRNGSLVVGVTGNDGVHAVSFPGNLTQVIATSCVDGSRGPCPFNTGPETDIAAPGWGVLSACPDVFSSCVAPFPPCFQDTIANYTRCSGTSMSAPHVSGAAALIWSTNTTASNAQVRNVLECATDNLGVAGWDPVYGNGLLNVSRALAYAQAGDWSCSTPFCSPGIEISGNYDGKRYIGTVFANITHTLGGHVGAWSVTASDGARMVVRQPGHDQFTISNTNTTPRKTTLHAELTCGNSVTTSWNHWN